MDKLQFFTGGHPFQIDDIEHLQAGIIDALKGICLGLDLGATSVILSGCQVTKAGFNYTITEGYIYYNSEIFHVPSHVHVGVGAAYWSVVQTAAPSDPVTYEDLTTHDVHLFRTLNLTTGAGDILVSVVKYLKQAVGYVPFKGIINYCGPISDFTTAGLGKPYTPVHGYALCNGQTHSGVATPDLRGRFIVGLTNNDATNYGYSNTEKNLTMYLTANPLTIPKTGGEHDHTLTIAELAAHQHEIGNDGAHSHTVGIGDSAGSNTGPQAQIETDTTSPYTSSSEPDHNHGGDTGDGTSYLAPNKLEGLPHNNIPPFYTLAYIMKL